MNTVFKRAIVAADNRSGRWVARVERAELGHAILFCAKGQ